MTGIYPIATSRVSDSLIRARLSAQLDFDQHELLRIQDQVSTGYRISTPSQDPTAAIRAIGLQRVLEQKQQAKVNLNTTDSFIAATDTALSGATDLLANVKTLALRGMDTTLSNEQRDVLQSEIQSAVQQFIDVGNQKFRGRYLFAGTQGTEPPFSREGQYVVYHGNENKLQNYIDVDYLSDTNITGVDAFGAISTEVLGTSDLNPILTENTRLSDLREGEGINQGSFLISDGTTTKTIDISSAATIRDIIELIENNPPTGREINVTLSNHGLIVDMDDAGGGNLTIREVAGGVTATELGIHNDVGVGTGPLVGSDLHPRLTLTTDLRDILGSRASARLESAGGHNDIYIEAIDNGTAFNNVQIQFTSGVAVGNQAIATYDSFSNTLSIDISPSVTQANVVIDAINATGVFTARLDDKLDTDNGGLGVVEFAANAVTSGGSGENLDQSSGLQIFNGGQSHTIDLSTAETIEDLLNALNGSSANVYAAINDEGTGIDVRSRLSGSDFMIGENGGTTATQLGIRTFNTGTYLSELNYGRGIDDYTGTDFRIQRRDGVLLDIDVAGAETIQDVIDLINNHPSNVGNVVTARLAEFGNGIELEDANAGAQDLTVIRVNGFTAWDLGFVPYGEEQNVATAAGASQVLTGRDVHPLETSGVFNSLLRLATAVANFDIPAIERTANALDDDFTDIAFVRAELGSKARSLQTIHERIENHDVSLQAALSNEIDTDLAQAISELTARQANLEATLSIIAQTLQLSVLHFL